VKTTKTTIRASERSALSDRQDLRENRTEKAPRDYYEDERTSLFVLCWFCRGYVLRARAVRMQGMPRTYLVCPKCA